MEVLTLVNMKFNLVFIFIYVHSDIYLQVS